MNEVEKMYRNSGIKKIELDYPDNFEPFYPEFTAEKQLELIKWLAIKGDVCRIDTTVKEKWFVENEVQTSECFAEFENSLANVINKLWADMPEEERKQIKEILE